MAAGRATVMPLHLNNLVAVTLFDSEQKNA
jgi:hypothetical protein